MSESTTRRKRGCRYWFNLLAVGLAGGLLFVYAGYIAIWIYWTAHPARQPVCCITPDDLGLQYQEISFEGSEGVTLSGWYLPSQNGAALILLHGYGANRSEMVHRAAMLAGHGYGVLLYDERASGESEGDARSMGWADDVDVVRALQYLEAQEDVDPDRIGLLGFSVGGQIALRAAARSDRLRAVVAEEPGFATLDDLPPLQALDERWIALNYWLGFKGLSYYTGVRPPLGVVSALSAITPRPILFIAAGPREEPGYWLVRHFYDRANQPKQFWYVPEAEHGAVPSIDPDEYERRITAFFDQALLGGGGPD